MRVGMQIVIIRQRTISAHQSFENAQQVEKNQFGEYELEHGFDYWIYNKPNAPQGKGLVWIQYDLITKNGNNYFRLQHPVSSQMHLTAYQKIYAQPIRAIPQHPHQIMLLNIFSYASHMHEKLQINFVNKQFRQRPTQTWAAGNAEVYKNHNAHAPKLLPKRDNAHNLVSFRNSNPQEAEKKRLQTLRDKRRDERREWAKKIHRRELTDQEEMQAEAEEQEWLKEWKNVIVAPFEIPLSTPNRYILSLE